MSKKSEVAVVPDQPAPPPAVKIDGIVTNLDLSTWIGKAMVVAAGCPSDLSFGDDRCVRIKAVSYLCMEDRGVDPETGETHEYTRTVLYDRMGRTFRTTAAYAPERMALVMRLYNAAEWAAGIPFLIQERRSPKTGRTYHDLRIDLEAEQYER